MCRLPLSLRHRIVILGRTYSRLTRASKYYSSKYYTHHARGIVDGPPHSTTPRYSWPTDRLGWAFGVSNICPDTSNSGPPANPNIHRVDVVIDSTPSVYMPRIPKESINSAHGICFPGNLKESNSETSKIIASALEHTKPSSPILDIGDRLNASLAAQYPKARLVASSYFPNIKSGSNLKGLSRAICIVRTYIDNKKSIDTQKGTISSTDHYVITSWQFPIRKNSLDIIISIKIETKEHLTLSIYDLQSKIIQSRKNLNLGQLHPTFDIHQKVAEHTVPFLEEEEDTAPIRLARLVFGLADEQSPCKRIATVDISMKIGTKKTANPFGDNVRVLSYTSIDRVRYEQSQNSRLTGILPNDSHRVYVALGSNVGDRIGNIESACQRMHDRGIIVSRTSALYETKAMYLEDQQSFINGACEVTTSLGPTELLDQLKVIEKDLGREKTIDNGPRTMDLDILLYEDKVLESERLSIPHQRMLEREFVLRPLCDLIPNETMPTPCAVANFQDLLDTLPSPLEPLSPLTPLSPQLAPLSSQNLTRPTHVMAILNLTPDSFSDGGLHSTTDPSKLLPTIKAYLAGPNPITILDIGGQSTRPRAPQISPDEELSRTLPAIELLRSDPSFTTLAISIDTYRASVAAAAITAGANIINDVSAGQMDPEMLPTIAKLGCTCILMHMRGTPETMNALTDYPDGIIAGVGSELVARVRAAEEAGIRRWRIILDPGIGFAKTQAQNLELLRRFSELRDFEGLRGFPWVVGASRKSFIGRITGVDDAKERKWGTAAAITAAVQGGADVVRVHDVGEMGQVVKMADAIWRV